MRNIAFLLLVTGLRFPNIAIGEANNQCGKYPEVTQSGWASFADAQCDCGSNLSSKYRYQEPSGMTLVAVCGFRRDERGEPYGGFFFRGQNVITASVVHQENPSGIDLYFESWKFIEEEDAIKAFKAPTLSNSAQCWMAEATVELTQLLIMEGPGSDQDGEWLLKYRVIEVGKYKAC